MRAALRHVVADLLGSVGVIVRPGHPRHRMALRRPLVSVLIGVLVLASSWRVLRESLGVLLEAAPEGIDADAVGRRMAAVEGVSSPTTCTSGPSPPASPPSRRVLVPEGEDCARAAPQLSEMLRRDFGNHPPPSRWSTARRSERPSGSGSRAADVKSRSCDRLGPPRSPRSRSGCWRLACAGPPPRRRRPRRSRSSPRRRSARSPGKSHLRLRRRLDAERQQEREPPRHHDRRGPHHERQPERPRPPGRLQPHLGAALDQDHGDAGPPQRLERGEGGQRHQHPAGDDGRREGRSTANTLGIGSSSVWVA